MRSIVIDCETTGFTGPSCSDLVSQPYITELAVAIIKDGKVQEQASWMFRPPVPISAEITKITGITQAMVDECAPFCAAVPGIVAMFNKAPDQLFAHNAPFDTDCLRYELLRCGSGVAEKFPWPPVIICTVQEYVHEFGRRPKLTELYERKLGKPLAQQHRAMSDVNALIEVILQEQLA